MLSVCFVSQQSHLNPRLGPGFDRPLALPAASPGPSAGTDCDAAEACGGPGTADTDAAATPPLSSCAGAPPSQQPALVWLAGRVPVAPGDTLPLLATHNTVRLSFEFPGARFSRRRDSTPSMPAGHFSAAAEGARLEATARALRAALARCTSLQGQWAPSCGRCLETPSRGASTLPNASTPQMAAGKQGPEEAPVAGGGGGKDASCLDVGAGAGALSQLALAVGVRRAVGAEMYEPLAACARRGLAAAAAVAGAAVDAAPASAAALAAAATDAAAATNEAPAAAPAAADSSAPPDGAAGAGAAGRPPLTQRRRPAAMMLLTDAAALQPGAHGGAVPATGFDLIVGDVFGPDPSAGQALQLLEAVRARLLAPGGAMLPARVAVWAAGLELSAARAGWPAAASGGEDLSGGGMPGWDFSALDRYLWGPRAEAVQLADTPHAWLTAPARLFEFQLEERAGADAAASGAGGKGGGKAQPEPAPGASQAGGAPLATGHYTNAAAAAAAEARYPRRALVELAAARQGTLNAVAVWFDLDLGSGITLTTGEWSGVALWRVCRCAQQGGGPNGAGAREASQGPDPNQRKAAGCTARRRCSTSITWRAAAAAALAHCPHLHDPSLHTARANTLQPRLASALVAPSCRLPPCRVRTPVVALHNTPPPPPPPPPARASWAVASRRSPASRAAGAARR
jgi:hypothetical protein